MPNPFSEFFDGADDEQRGGTDERAQRVTDYVIHLRHAEGITVLSILDSYTENAADKRRKGDSAPAGHINQHRA